MPQQVPVALRHVGWPFVPIPDLWHHPNLGNVLQQFFLGCNRVARQQGAKVSQPLRHEATDVRQMGVNGICSELCGKADRTRISYTVSESSANANVGWLSGRTSSSKGSVSASKQYQKHKEPLFEEKIFFDIQNVQSVVVAFDGICPLPPTYCYLKPDFLPITMSWFDQGRIAFDPERIPS